MGVRERVWRGEAFDKGGLYRCAKGVVPLNLTTDGGQWDGRLPVPVKQKYIGLAPAVPESSCMVSVAARQRVPTFTMTSSIAKTRALIAPDTVDHGH